METSFGSDNHSGVHPKVLQALTDANRGYCLSYEEDSYTAKAVELFRSIFGEDTHTYFAFNGTAANVLCLQALTRPHHAVVCARTAHLNRDECGAPERFTGCKLLTAETPDGKLRPEDVLPLLTGFGFQHHVQPRVVSISQVTELGTVYRPEEIKALADLAHSHNMYLHMDGSRLANAAAFLDVSFADMTRNAGVDALSFGGTKNGMLMGEAVVFFQSRIGTRLLIHQKTIYATVFQKPFYCSAILGVSERRLGGWKTPAMANSMAQYLAESLEGLPGVQITQKVESNAVFAIIPKDVYKKLAEKHFFLYLG